MSQEMTIKLFMSGPEPTCINFKTFQEIVKYLTKVIDSHENMSSLEIRLLPALRGDRSNHLEDGVKKVMSTGSLTKRKSIYHVEHEYHLKRYKSLCEMWEITPGKRVRISTIHGAKGAEADNVLINTDMSRRCFEQLCEGGDAEASERRVWYVGMTRSRNEINILRPRSKYYFDV